MVLKKSSFGISTPTWLFRGVVWSALGAGTLVQELPKFFTSPQMASTKETISGVPQPAGMELAELNHRSDSLGSWDVGIFNSGGRHPAVLTSDANAADRPLCVVNVSAGAACGGAHSAVPALDAEILTAVRAQKSSRRFVLQNAAIHILL